MGNRLNKLMSCSLLALVAVVLMTITYAAAEKKTPSPKFIPGSTIVDSEGVIKLVMSTPNVTIIDARIKSDRKQGYIEGSVSLPNINTTCDTLAKIVEKKSTPTLYYCNGVKCGRSAKSVKIALDCGYNNIYWFRGGYEEWQAKGYPVLTD